MVASESAMIIPARCEIPEHACKRLQWHPGIQPACAFNPGTGHRHPEAITDSRISFITWETSTQERLLRELTVIHLDDAARHCELRLCK